MSDAPEESLPQNQLHEQMILDLHVCIEECEHYTRSNLQLLQILYSLFQGQSSVSISTTTEGAVYMFKKTYYIIIFEYSSSIFGM